MHGIHSILCLVINFLLFGFARSNHEKDTTFDLYTRPHSKPDRLLTNDTSTFINSRFKSCRKTAILITGLNQPDDHPLILLSMNLMTSKNYNVVVVNYLTTRFITTTPKTGHDIAEFLEIFTQALTVDPQNIVLVGASLGAHIAGFAGKNFPGLGRIMGLDPSGPIYDFLPHRYRLSRDDATIVDVIHSSQLYGTVRWQMGHVDFVINGGSGHPGCSSFDFECNHIQAIQLFVASVGVCSFQFLKCSNYLSYRLGLCAGHKTLEYGLGMNISAISGIEGRYFYDFDWHSFPFCDPYDSIQPSYSGKIC